MNSDPPPTVPAAGIWTLVDGVAALHERWDVGPAVLAVPTEAVLLLGVDLPLAARRQRLAALPFAVEDRIADPLAAVHVALGAEIAPQVHLAAVVDRGVMAAWVAAFAAAGLGHAAIVPDALLLPPPSAGSWSLAAAGTRVVVRTDTGTGFAVAADRFVALWRAGGQLPCTVYGAPPPFDLAMSATASVAPGTPPLPPIDLRQGDYAAPARPLPAAMRRLGLIVAAGLLAHTAVAAADTLRLRGVADAHRATTAALVEQVLPGTPPTADLDRLLPSGGVVPGRFLPLLVRAANALAPVGGLAFDRLGYGDDGALTLGIEASDIGGLQRAQAALAAAGLSPVSGTATAGTGRADGEIVVREAAS